MLHSVSTHSNLHKPSPCTSACDPVHPSESGQAIKARCEREKLSSCTCLGEGVACGGRSASHVQV